MPRVSIVMPAFNAAAHIGAAVSSALSQTVDDLEVVVVDDGSTDETAAIAAAHGARVRVVSQPQRGVAEARNRGIEEARAPLIAFCDADDILFPAHVEAMLATREATGATIVTANAYWLFSTGIDPRKTRHRGRFPAPDRQRRSILEQNFVSTMSLFPTGLAGDVGPFSPDLRHAEDWDFWMRAVFAGHRVAHQPRPLALYRWGEGLSANTDAMDAAVREVLRRALARLDLTDEEAAYVRMRLDAPLPAELLRGADRALLEGRYRDARRDYVAAAALIPDEAPVVWKSRILRVAPAVTGRALAWQHRRADRRRGSGTHVR